MADDIGETHNLAAARPELARELEAECERNLGELAFDAGDLKYRDYFTTLSVFPEDAPDKPEYVELDFAKGDCVAVNGKKLTPGEIGRAHV